MSSGSPRAVDMPGQSSASALQLFVYYRIPKDDIQQALGCAHQLMQLMEQQGLGTAKLYQREETDKPYFTLMEVIHPAKPHQVDMLTYLSALQTLATNCFSKLPQQPARHTEIFTELEPPCA